MAKLIHISMSHDESGALKFDTTDWPIVNEVGDDIHVIIGGGEGPKTSVWKSLVMTPHPDTRLDITNQFGWILANEGKEEEAKILLRAAARDAVSATIRILNERIESFRKKGGHLFRAN